METLGAFSILLTVGCIYAIYVLVTLLRATFEENDMLLSENKKIKEALRLVEHEYEDAAVIDAKN